MDLVQLRVVGVHEMLLADAGEDAAISVHGKLQTSMVLAWAAGSVIQSDVLGEFGKM